jgi:hypothetical protein
MPPITDRPRSGGCRRFAASVSAQLASIAVVWLYVVLLHKGNDGLWYTGDAARHAINGFFWWDFLTSAPSSPKGFALSYYARYPTISPVAYPPLVYLLEGVCYHLIAPSPFVAKGVVQAFTLAGALYLAAWLRRWVRPEAGWGGALMVLQPGMIIWSNAVMLNVPATALTVATLFHTRRWSESGSPRHGFAAVVLAMLAFLTYFQAAIPLLVVPLWLVTNGHWPKRIVVVFAFLCLLPLALLISRWAPLSVSVALPSVERILDAESWIYYASAERKLLDRTILLLAPLGAIASIMDRSVRREVALTSVWIVVPYGVLSTIVAREARYGLFLVPPLLILATIGLWWVSRTAMTLVGGEVIRCFCAGLAALIALGAYGAQARRIPFAEGFEPVVAFLENQATGGRILYAGEYDGVFTFYLRAEDPAFRWAVVRASKLLYASAIFADLRLTERVSSAKEVTSIVQKECGCGWVAIERTNGPDPVAAIGYLREALGGPEFQRVASFPIDSQLTRAVDVYRVVMPIEVPETLELPFPILGEGITFGARPIER